MVMKENEIPSGWPLGLGNMKMKFRVAGTSQNATTESYISRPIRSTSSFSSFSSSYLDNESTSSFFPDRSVSLGRLIGIQPRNRGNSYYPNVVLNQHGNLSVTRSDQDEFEDQDNSQGLCVTLHNVMGKMGRSRSSTRH